MSQGRFTNRFYEADSGDIHLMRQQPETAVLSVNSVDNTVPAGPATSIFWVKVSKGKNEYGMSPRKLRLRWNPDAQPEGYKEEEEFEVPIYQASVYNGATIEAPFTYLGGSGVVKGKIPENVFPVT